MQNIAMADPTDNVVKPISQITGFIAPIVGACASPFFPLCFGFMHLYYNGIYDL